jgi:hypothetical protein
VVAPSTGLKLNGVSVQLSLPGMDLTKQLTMAVQEVPAKGLAIEPLSSDDTDCASVQ